MSINEMDSKAKSYFDLLAEIIQVCENHGLLNSGDRIEDYGEHWYIVRNCGIGWPRNGRI